MPPVSTTYQSLYIDDQSLNTDERLASLTMNNLENRLSSRFFKVVYQFSVGRPAYKY